jgi:hypothetical protein
MTEITLKLTFEELKANWINLWNSTMRPDHSLIKSGMLIQNPETLLDVIRNLGYSVDMCYGRL